MQSTWLLKSFAELTTNELYGLLQLRSEVFVVEQNCPFLDMDDKDQACYHLMGYVPALGPGIQAYTRLVPPGISFPFPSIGRVVTSPQARRTGLGRMLMSRSLEECERLFGSQPIQIGAQLYLRTFYESFGFVQSGDMYLEDGIEHIEMIRPM
ncbi:GNAT family N-acetyltransferase [Arundinibacter roseus]|uniref:GNAT family N-acetyltransferase n=1 Tax=Arundinibacter roseus TaxID=2070510 RepID=A0A4R4K1E7_9BACT|nr:GNAT family N-acetyltransferase [Arundinibacter roseus]TDB61107.1 GNAT family N-acetyltransferase [Arundinibacter roseus]